MLCGKADRVLAGVVLVLFFPACHGHHCGHRPGQGRTSPAGRGRRGGEAGLGEAACRLPGEDAGEAGVARQLPAGSAARGNYKENRAGIA